MDRPRSYRPVYAEEVTEFLLQLPRRRQRKLLDLGSRLARDPHVRSDYHLPDESGRKIEHLLIEDFVFSYWVDDAAREVRIIEIEDAS